MTTKEFGKHIQATALLTQDRKDYYTDRSDKHSPETRKKMIKELLKQEEEFITTQTVRIQSEERTKNHEELMTNEVEQNIKKKLSKRKLDWKEN